MLCGTARIRALKIPSAQDGRGPEDHEPPL